MTTQQNFPQYQSFNCLDNTVAEHLMLDYKAQVETSGNTNLINLFTNGSEYLLGYSISLSDYTAMISFPGVAKWKLRFAYKQGEQNNMLQFLLVGCTTNGVRMTPYLQLNNQKRLLTPPIFPPASGNSWVQVPSALMATWKEAYSALISGGNIPPALLQSPWGSGNTLEGYNFEFSDFLDVLNNNQSTLPADSSIELRIVNHAEYKQGDTQSTKPGMIGVAIAAVSSESDGPTFYDISKPCPPTC